MPAFRRRPGSTARQGPRPRPRRHRRFQEDGRLSREADAGRRARGDHVARLERHGLRQERHDVVDTENQLRRGRILHRLAVEPKPDAQRMRIAREVAHQDERAHRRKRVAGLAPLPLAIGKLEVPCADVVEVHVSEHVVEGALDRNVLGATADDDGHFGLVVHLLRDVRQARSAGLDPSPKSRTSRRSPATTAQACCSRRRDPCS